MDDRWILEPGLEAERIMTELELCRKRTAKAERRKPIRLAHLRRKVKAVQPVKTIQNAIPAVRQESRERIVAPAKPGIFSRISTWASKFTRTGSK